jgi:hypothetical protein
MKAVNQCIGRAIRHQNDYAAMILLDKRYQAQHVRMALPAWIENNLTICKEFSSGFAALRKVLFYLFCFGCITDMNYFAVFCWKEINILRFKVR